MSDETIAHQHVPASAPDAVSASPDETSTPAPHGATAARGRRSASPFVAAAVGAVILGAGSAVTVQAFASDGHPVQSQNQRGGMGGPGGMGGMGGMGAPGGMGGMQGGSRNGAPTGTTQNGTTQNGTTQNGTRGGAAQNGAPVGGQAAPGGPQQNAAPGA